MRVRTRKGTDFEVIEWYVGLKPFLSTRDVSISGS